MQENIYRAYVTADQTQTPNFCSTTGRTEAPQTGDILCGPPLKLEAALVRPSGDHRNARRVSCSPTT
jgi:hypothetical protein